MGRLSTLKVVDVRADQSFLSNLEDSLEEIGAGWLRFGPSTRNGDAVTHRLNDVPLVHSRSKGEHVFRLLSYGTSCTIRIMTDGSLPGPDTSDEARSQVLTIVEDILVVIRQAVQFSPRLAADAEGDRFIRALCAMRPRTIEEANFPLSFLMAGPWSPFGLTSGRDFHSDPLCRELSLVYAPAGRIAPLRASVIQTTASDGERIVAILPTRREWGTPNDPMSALRDLDELNRKIATNTPWEES